MIPILVNLREVARAVKLMGDAYDCVENTMEVLKKYRRIDKYNKVDLPEYKAIKNMLCALKASASLSAMEVISVQAYAQRLKRDHLKDIEGYEKDIEGLVQGIKILAQECNATVVYGGKVVHQGTPKDIKIIDDIMDNALERMPAREC